MQTNNRFIDFLKSLIGSPGPVVVCIGGQKMAANIGMIHGDYVTLNVDKAMLTGNAPVALSDVPNGRMAPIEVPIAAISWIGRAP